jgi:hypothetical protein
MRFGRPITSIVGSSLAVTAAVAIVVFSLVVLNTASDTLDPSLFGAPGSSTQKPDGLSSLSLPTAPEVSSTRQTRVFPSSSDVLGSVTTVTAEAVDDTPLESALTSVQPSSESSKPTSGADDPGEETTREPDEPDPGDTEPGPSDPGPEEPDPGAGKPDESEWRAEATGWAHRPPHEPPTAEAAADPTKPQSIPSPPKLRDSSTVGRDESGPTRRPTRASGRAHPKAPSNH